MVWLKKLIAVTWWNFLSMPACNVRNKTYFEKQSQSKMQHNITFFAFLISTHLIVCNYCICVIKIIEKDKRSLGIKNIRPYLCYCAKWPTGWQHYHVIWQYHVKSVGYFVSTLN